ncbi:hypothetical protein P7K49_003178 [Saguinus oedipus]|uniref:EGF-like calcium-binding domain-containing protein n=1 Tax=Saguinus oedipus TaxID=9490 RepID=A0ABQ9WNH6_SAGOE|nr:hypothetical protein P7K49_003178 [Saguinus oedipus]
MASLKSCRTQRGSCPEAVSSLLSFICFYPCCRLSLACSLLWEGFLSSQLHLPPTAACAMTHCVLPEGHAEGPQTSAGLPQINKIIEVEEEQEDPYLNDRCRDLGLAGRARVDLLRRGLVRAGVESLHVTELPGLAKVTEASPRLGALMEERAKCSLPLCPWSPRHSPVTIGDIHWSHKEMFAKLRGGPCKQQCRDTGDEVVCSCFVGYQLLSDGVSCEDVNECITGSHSCRLGESCINTVGSFRCQRDSSCGTGYELTEDNSCKDTARWEGIWALTVLRPVWLPGRLPARLQEGGGYTHQTNIRGVWAGEMERESACQECSEHLKS